MLTVYRAKELDVIMGSRDLSDGRKEQKKNSMRKSEANFLRFLRSVERPQNYSTLKIIGKGAFGEVKLVQRKHDGKIYALKSLIKAEMVRLPARLFTKTQTLVSRRSYANLRDSIRRISSLTFAPSVTSLPTPTRPGLSSCIPPSKTAPSCTCSWSSYLVVTS